MTMQLSVVILASVLAGLPLKHDRTIAVLCVGEDAALTGQIQDEIVNALAEGDVGNLMSMQAVANAIGADVEAKTAYDEAAARLSQELLAEAERAYYSDDLARAQRALDAVVAHYDRSDYVVPDQRVRLHLWEASLALAQEEEAAAQRAALLALTLDPELEVDTDVFRPSTRRLVDKLKQTLDGYVSLSLSGVPEHATVMIDGRKREDLPAHLPAGMHFLSVEAHGYMPIKTRIAVREDTTSEVHMPVALDEDLERELLDIVWDGAPSARQRAYLSNIGADLGAQTLIIVGSETRRSGRLRAYVWHKEFKGGRSTEQLDLTETAELVEAIREELRRPKPPPIPDDAWLVRLSYGGGFTSWVRYYEVAPDDRVGGFKGEGHGFVTTVPGAFLRFDANLERRFSTHALVGDARLELTEYHLHPTSVYYLEPEDKDNEPIPDRQGDVIATGSRLGMQFDMRFGMGYQLSFSRGKETPFALNTLMGGYVTNYGGASGLDFNANGQALVDANEIPGRWLAHSTAGPDFRLQLQVPLDWLRAAVRAEFGLQYPIFIQRPKGGYGVEPRPRGPALYFNANTSFVLMRWWDVQIYWNHYARRVRFFTLRDDVRGPIFERDLLVTGDLQDRYNRIGFTFRRRF